MKAILVSMITLLSTATALADAGKAQDQADLAKLQVGEFVAVYTDQSNNLAWSKALPGTYSNGCFDAGGFGDHSKCTYESIPSGGSQVRVDDSEAAKACRDIGARLPTIEEYESLIRGFDTTEGGCGPKLTAKGRDDMLAIFGDMDKYTVFWSSSVITPDPAVYAYIFLGAFGDYEFCSDVFSDYRSRSAAVRCVSAP